MTYGWPPQRGHVPLKNTGETVVKALDGLVHERVDTYVVCGMS